MGTVSHGGDAWHLRLVVVDSEDIYQGQGLCMHQGPASNWVHKNRQPREDKDTVHKTDTYSAARGRGRRHLQPADAAATRQSVYDAAQNLISGKSIVFRVFLQGLGAGTCSPMMRRPRSSCAAAAPNMSSGWCA